MVSFVLKKEVKETEEIVGILEWLENRSFVNVKKGQQLENRIPFV